MEFSILSFAKAGLQTSGKWINLFGLPTSGNEIGIMFREDIVKKGIVWK